MLCPNLKSKADAEFFALVSVVERIEFETPQVVYLVACAVCGDIHSMEYTLPDEPPTLRDLCGKKDRTEPVAADGGTGPCRSAANASESSTARAA